jgi:outer membrane protein TolC
MNLLKHSRVVAGILFFAIAAAAEDSHVVTRGETLYSIARDKLGAQPRWKEIADLNRLAPPYTLRPGMTLRMPDLAAGSKPGVSPQTIALVDTAPDPVSVPAHPIEAPAPTLSAPISHPPGALVLRDVDEAVALARAVHPEYRALAAEAKAAEAGIRSARLAGAQNPQIEGEVGRRSNGATDLEPARSSTDFEAAVSREFEVGGQSSARIDVARMEVARQLLDAATKERALVLEIKTAFVRALAALDRHLLLKEAERMRRELESATRARHDAGDASGMELSLAQLEAARSASARTRGDRELRDALAHLSTAMGLGTDSAIFLDAHLFAPSDPPSDIVVSALRRPELDAALLDEKLLLARSRRALAEGRPNVTLGGGYRREERTNEIYFARISIPLPLTNRNRGESDRLGDEAAAAAAHAETMRRNILVEVDRASAALRLARERFHELETAMEKADENLRLLEDARLEGLVSLSEYVYMQSASFEAREEFVEALAEANLAVVEFERASGLNLYTRRK